MERKNRGMLLESLINKTISFYKENDIGIFHKKEIPIKFSSVNKNGNQLKVNNAFILQKSTTDYYGLSNGSFYAFEAKSTNDNVLPFKNIKKHQIQYLLEVNKHGGRGFFIIAFATHNKFFIIWPEELMEIERKSLTLDQAEQIGIEITLMYPGILDFIKCI